jgi:uncharacterized protein
MRPLLRADVRWRDAGGRSVAEQGDLTFDPQKFSGRVRLFPLPDLVMFPHVMQPLHIFEPRYRDLVADALADDRLMAMAVLAPGWEGKYEGQPAIAPVACLARIVSCRQLADGRYNLFALGVQRVVITHELPAVKSYREADARLLDDVYPSATALARSSLQRKLTTVFKQLLPTLSDNLEQFEQLLSGELSLGMLTDLVAFALSLPHDAKRQLLEQQLVDRRAKQLLQHLTELADRHISHFPPQFSAN